MQKIFALLAVIAFVPACAHLFTPRYDGQAQYFESLDKVPIVVVVRLVPNAPTPIGAPFEAEAIPFGPIQLFKVSGDIENVLKGDARLGRDEIFYFASAIPHGSPSSSMALYSNQQLRVMMLLRREAGHLRVVTDVSGCCSAAVYSGSHPGILPSPAHSLEETMVGILLTRGYGADDIGMARAIFSGTPSEISLEYTLQSLLRLASSETPAVRIAACRDFRDQVVLESLRAKSGRLPVLMNQFGIDAVELDRWHEEFAHDGSALALWDHSLHRGLLPPFSLPKGSTLAGMSLCSDDKALGITPLLLGTAQTKEFPTPHE